MTKFDTQALILSEFDKCCLEQKYMTFFEVIGHLYKKCPESPSSTNQYKQLSEENQFVVNKPQ